MDIDVVVAGESLPIKVENHFQMDVDAVVERIGEFLSGKGLSREGLHLKELLPRMVQGIAGCEKGCPADAQNMVRNGFKTYDLAYVEGGILTARYEIKPGSTIEIKMFPEF